MVTEIYTGSEAVSIADRETLQGIFSSSTFQWYYNPITVTEDISPKANRSQFTHSIYQDETVCSNLYSLIYDIFSYKIPEFKTHKLNQGKSKHCTFK